MKINWKTLCATVTSASEAGLPIQQVLKVVGTYYCTPMTVRGLCTSTCANCKLSLTRAFYLGEANKPIALLIWNLKNEQAKNQEIDKHEAPKQVDVFGLPMSEEDPFALFGRELEGQTTPLGK
jgi:hypothetical protein